jgi:hypothetical protein
MLIKFINKVKFIKLPKVYKCHRYLEDCSKYCICEEQFNKIIKDLNINIVTLSMKQKDDIKEEENKTSDRCD